MNYVHNMQVKQHGSCAQMKQFGGPALSCLINREYV